MKRASDMPTFVSRMVSLAVLLAGLFVILQPLLHRLPGRLARLFPRQIEYATHAFDIILGLTLVYLAMQLWQRKYVAWVLTTTTTGLLCIGELMYNRNHLVAIFLAVVGSALFFSRRYFQARSEILDIRRGLIIFLLSIVLAIVYGTVGFYLLDRRDFGIDFSLRQSVVRSLREYSLVGNADLTPRSRHADYFLDSLGLIGIVSFLFGLYSLFRPLAYEYSALPAERQRMRALLEKFSRSTDDFFKLWPHDKSYFFADGYQAGLAYGVAAGAALVVGDPVGQPGALPELINQFDHLCLSHSWSPVFLMVGSEQERLYIDTGYDLLKIGEDAIVPLELFASITSANKHFRNIRNRFDKAGYTFELSLPPHNPVLLSELAGISAVWRRNASHQEWQLFAGYFSKTYLLMGPLFLVKDETGKVQAFANQLTSFVPDWATIDLMRYHSDAPSNIMDYLLMMTMLQLYEQGYKKFNLGLAPLAGLEHISEPEERVLNLIFQMNQKFLGFQGLRQFKNKFEPAWESRYLAYKGGAAALVKTGIALNRLGRRR